MLAWSAYLIPWTYRTMKTQVRISTRFHRFPWLRQTPGGKGEWNSFHFYMSGDKDGEDWLIVYDEPNDLTLTTLPKKRRVLFIGEPPDYKRYPKKYLNQFGLIVSPYPLKVRGSLCLIANPALPWFAGVDFSDFSLSRGLESLEELDWQNSKKKLISVVCSMKDTLEEQKLRLRFVELLEREFGTEVDVFGRGRRPISDKLDAILPYKYHIVLENNTLPNFWTEKLADTYLGGSFPIYFGSSNLSEYFSDNCFERIDLGGDLDLAMKVVHKTVDSSRFERELGSLSNCRNLVMSKYNFFSVCSEILEKNSQPFERLKSPTEIFTVQYFLKQKFWHF